MLDDRRLPREQAPPKPSGWPSPRTGHRAKAADLGARTPDDQPAPEEIARQARPVEARGSQQKYSWQFPPASPSRRRVFGYPWRARLVVELEAGLRSDGMAVLGVGIKGFARVEEISSSRRSRQQMVVCDVGGAWSETLPAEGGKREIGEDGGINRPLSTYKSSKHVR